MKNKRVQMYVDTYAFKIKPNETVNGLVFRHGANGVYRTKAGPTRDLREGGRRVCNVSSGL